MQIIAWRRVTEAPTKRGFTTLATFDLEVTDGVRLYSLDAVRAPDGKVIVYAPAIFLPGGASARKRSATFRTDVGDALADEIMDKIGNGHERHDAAAA